MKVQAEFSRHASHYGEYNVIQNKVAQKMVQDLEVQPKRIIDLGCGSGTLYRHINWELDRYLGIDFSHEMLALHPQTKGVQCIWGDFNDPGLFKNIDSSDFDFLFSASALQWAEDLQMPLRSIAALKLPYSLSIFTSGTFKTLHHTAQTTAVLRSSEKVKELVQAYLPDASMEKVEYTLSFESVREMFRYIKKSGVSGSRQVLNYKETKALMQNYPLKYLEFEVLFIRSY